MKKFVLAVLFLLTSCCPITVAVYNLVTADSITFGNVFCVIAEVIIGLSVAVYLFIRAGAYYNIIAYKLKHFKWGFDLFWVAYLVLMHSFEMVMILRGENSYVLYTSILGFLSIGALLSSYGVYFNEKYIYVGKFGKLICVDDITQFDIVKEDKHSAMAVKITTSSDENYEFYLHSNVEGEFTATFKNPPNNLLG